MSILDHSLIVLCRSSALCTYTMIYDLRHVVTAYYRSGVNGRGIATSAASVPGDILDWFRCERDRLADEWEATQPGDDGDEIGAKP